MVLGITAEASMADIKRAFRRKVRECHPDVLAEDDPGDERVKEVVKAYRALMSGEALSRSEWIAAAFKASGHVDSAPVMQTELPVFSLKPSIIFAITAGVACLLYTSDAADDLPFVDLGGRGIIKKKNTDLACISI